MLKRQYLDQVQSLPDFDIVIVQPAQLAVNKKNNVEASPVTILYFHGGGWVLGSYKTHRNLVCKLCLNNQCSVVFVKYTRSPEPIFPVGMDQGLDALDFIVGDGSRFNINSDNIFIAGDSAGGNFATIIAMKAKQTYLEKHIKGQILLYPVTNFDFCSASYTQFANGPWLTRKAVEYFSNAHEPNVKERMDPYVAPLQADPSVLAQLPRALIITDENDALRDEGEAYAHKPMAAGVSVTSTRALGTIHDFMMLNDLASSPATINAFNTIYTFINM